MTNDHAWMRQAIKLAELAKVQQEVPVGAVLVLNDQVIGEGYNCPIRTQDPSAHAEMRAIRAAAEQIGNYRLLDSTLYVTLEPCVMCASLLVHARIKRVVFGAFDPKAGAISSQINILELSWLNHRVEYQGGVLAAECGTLLKEFFQERRS